MTPLNRETLKASSRQLDELQRKSFDYFLHETNPKNGLVRDKTQRGAAASVAAVGLALSCYPVGVERKLIKRGDAIQRVLTTLRFFDKSVHSADPKATGYKGFYYHFLDMKSGRRAGKAELSTIDTAFLLAGMLTASAYFSGGTPDEREIARLAHELYARADWNWARNRGLTVAHGWKPETGFLPNRWQGYDEALFLYILGLGSPAHPLPKKSYQKWVSTYQWRKIYGHELLHSGPLFTHQISHLWIDFRGIQDAYMRRKKTDYFENSRRATLVQQQYAIHNPNDFDAYGAHCWGITASDGPGPIRRVIERRQRQFFGYKARGVPDGPDDGTLSPWAVVASLPFAPKAVLPTLRYFAKLKLRVKNPYGYKASFNPTFGSGPHRSRPWVSKLHYGLNQGPIILMIENYRSSLLWRIMRQCPHLVAGLRRAGFRGGWLGKA